MTSAIARSKFLSLPRPFGQILNEEIAKGRASSDTVKTYSQQFKLFVDWCKSQELEVATVTEEQVKEYRYFLAEKGFKVATIALKLTVVRRIFEIAVERGLMSINPALRVKPPTERKDAAAQNNYLELEEAQKLVATLPTDDSLASWRDRLLVSLMVIQGCRQIELHRLNVSDVIRRGNKVGIRVSGKGSIRVIPLKEEVASLLERYLEARKAAGETLKPKTAMFINLSRNISVNKENRLTRTSMQRIVNGYLKEAQLKHSESRTITTHGLRHTVGYLLTAMGKPLRVVQEFLGHSDPKTTALYAHIVNLWENNPVNEVEIIL